MPNPPTIAAAAFTKIEITLPKSRLKIKGPDKLHPLF
jgi:hypothetical protein